MGTILRWLLGMVTGLAVSIVLAEALMAFHELLSNRPALLQRLVAGDPLAVGERILLGAIWLLASAAGGALAAALGRLAGLGLVVGLGCAVALGFTALVGRHPDAWVLALALVPVLGALIGIRIAQHLRTLDGRAAGTAGSSRAEL